MMYLSSVCTPGNKLLRAPPRSIKPFRRELRMNGLNAEVKVHKQNTEKREGSESKMAKYRGKVEEREFVSRPSAMPRVLSVCVCVFCSFPLAYH